MGAFGYDRGSQAKHRVPEQLVISRSQGYSTLRHMRGEYRETDRTEESIACARTRGNSQEHVGRGGVSVAAGGGSMEHIAVRVRESAGRFGQHRGRPNCPPDRRVGSPGAPHQRAAVDRLPLLQRGCRPLGSTSLGPGSAGCGARRRRGGDQHTRLQRCPARCAEERARLALPSGRPVQCAATEGGGHRQRVAGTTWRARFAGTVAHDPGPVRVRAGRSPTAAGDRRRHQSLHPHDEFTDPAILAQIDDLVAATLAVIAPTSILGALV